MGKFLKTIAKTPPQQILARLLFRLNGRVVTLKPKGVQRGNVLLSYTSVPFTLLNDKQLGGHTNYWETKDMVQAFVERGYIVDVIDFTNTQFVPRKSYTCFIDIQSNLERLTPLLNKDCVKIFHATGAYWKFQNEAEQKRLAELKMRRGVSLLPRRVAQAYSLETVTSISSLCGTFPESTYAFLHKPIYHIPLSTTHMYPSPEGKDCNAVRKNFIWFGGAGAVHKGLDLVLEAFAVMPEYNLTVCGKFEGEMDFVDLYRKELYETPNIKCVGYVNPGENVFKNIKNNSLAIVYPSCSEGCASSVVICMHAGLIPIVSKETGVETGDFGITLTRSTVEEIRAAVRTIASESEDQLSTRSVKAWKYARSHHTRELFAKTFRNFIATLEQKYRP